MKKILYPTLLSGALALVFSACHKNNDKDVTINFNNLAGTYKLTGVVLSDGHYSVNTYDSVEACQKDDLWHFNKDSTFVYEDAGTVCSANGSYSSTWSLQGNILSVEGDPVLVKELTSKTLMIYAVDSSSTPAISTTETFTRQ